jgi:hypothetical protein
MIVLHVLDQHGFDFSDPPIDPDTEGDKPY